jgi:CDP-glucose 4,6-dehydratase
LKNFNRNFWNGKKVFITGHTGFKGSWLTIILKSLKSKIYGFSLKPPKKSLFNQSRIKYDLAGNTFGDINNLSLLRNKIKSFKPEIIFHLAAQPLVIDSYKDPLKTFQTNVMGTINLLESIRGIKSIKSVIIITTDKVYKIKKSNKNYTESDELGGHDPYSSSKVAAEFAVNSYIKSFFKTENLKNRICTARAGNVIGGGDYAKNRLVPDIIKTINNNSKLIIRNPNSIRPWQHVIEPLVGYLILAEYQYKNKSVDKNNSWNFGPNRNNFVKVIKVLNIIKKLKPLNFSIKKNILFKETEILRLNSNKSKKKLKWISKMDIKSSLIKVLEWNHLVKKNIPAREVCEKQFFMYINH